MNLFHRTIRPYYLLISLLAVLQACGGVNDSQIAKVSRTLADQLYNSSPKKGPQQETTSTEQRVYIDASLSMNGFVGDTGKVRTTFDEFIDSMPDVLPGCKVFRYGQPKGVKPTALTDVITRAEFDSQLHKQTFYGLEYNPDDLLFTTISQEQQPVMSILLTDGVESDSQGQINTTVVDAIKSWMGQGRTFAILALKSKFSGRPYSELQRKMLAPLTVEARPFYAFVFSTSRREFDDLEEKLRHRFTDMRTILFSDDSIVCKTEVPVDNEA